MSLKPWYGSTIAEQEAHAFSFMQGADYWGPTIPLTATEIERVDDGYNTWVTTRDNLQVAKDALRAAQADFDNARAAMIRTMQQVGAKVRVSPNTTDEILSAFGMTIPSGHTGGSAPQVPTDLVANPGSPGVNVLSWKRNGNAPRTIFNIEVRYGATGPWQLIGVTTRTKFQHEGQTPGRFAIYRVTASIRDLQSGYSNEAAIYAPMLSVA